MSQFTDLLKKYIRPYYYYIISLLILIILLLVAYHVLKRFNIFENFDVANDSNKQGTSCIIYFFHADWCPHCKKALPEWESFKQTNDGKMINGYKISCVDVNCTNEDDANTTQYINKFNVEGYPTIKMLKDGQTIDFDAKPTIENLTSFVESTL